MSLKRIIDPRSLASYLSMDADEKLQEVTEYLEAMEKAVNEEFASQQKALEDSQEELARERLSAKTALRMQTEPRRESMGTFERQEFTPVFRFRNSRRTSFFGAKPESPAQASSGGLFGRSPPSTPLPSSTPSTASHLSGSTFGTAAFPSLSGAGGGGIARSSSAGVGGSASLSSAGGGGSVPPSLSGAALGSILGAAMELQHLPIVKLRSFSKEDIDTFLKDHEAYEAVGGRKRIAEFLGGNQLQVLKDAMEAEGEDVPLRQTRDAQDQEIKPILFFPHRSPSHAVTKARLSKLKM